MIDSLIALLTGVVDYAGLFPPAKLDMAAAVRSYADYLHDPARFMLGRFIVPVMRLPEFEEEAGSLLPRGVAAVPWALGVLAGPDVAADVQQVLKFNCRHWSGSESGHAVIDTIEIKVSSPAEIGAVMSAMPGQLRPFFEVPIDTDPAPLVAEIRRTGACAKIRTGGITAEAFPPTTDVARFIERCREQRVPFKATAGLHHPVRATYRLTYDEDAPTGTMYGYLNLFVAAALAWDGHGREVLARALEETNAREFVFTDAGLSYCGHTLPTPVLREVRATFAMSFGSCSFREPVDDLAALPVSPIITPR